MRRWEHVPVTDVKVYRINICKALGDYDQYAGMDTFASGSMTSEWSCAITDLSGVLLTSPDEVAWATTQSDNPLSPRREVFRKHPLGPKTVGFS
jgi:hypothetical protein